MRAAATVLVLAAAFTVATPGVSTASGHARHPTVTIRMGDFFYKPSAVTVHVGQKVRFVNVGKIAHTVADTDRKGNVRSKLIKPRALEHGQSQTVAFARSGIVHYLCTFHPTLMRGTITVVR
jgi:plastocyanin